MPKSPEGQMSVGGKAKADEYIARIKAGEPAEKVMDGLPLSFRDAIEKGIGEKESKSKEYIDGLSLIPPQYKGLSAEILEDIWTIPMYADPEKTKSEQEKKRLAIEALRKEESTTQTKRMAESQAEQDRLAADAVRKKYGIPTEEASDSDFESEEKAKRRQIDGFFDSMAGGFGEAAKLKIKEYDERIRAARDGKPMKPGDTAEALMEDFKALTKQDWDENFGIDAPRRNQETNDTTKNAKPLVAEEINEILKKARNRTRIEGNTDLMTNPIDWKIGQRFDAHGIAKISITSQFGQLLDLLNKGIEQDRPFFTAPLEVNPEDKAGLGAGMGTGGGAAYKDGSFIIMGEIDKEIKKSGIRYVAVNDAYYDSIPRLQEVYPQVQFIRADELNETLKNIASMSKDGQVSK